MGFWEAVESMIFQGGSLREFLQFRQRQKFEGLMATVALTVYKQNRESLVQQGRDVQYEDNTCRVEIKNGYSRDHDQYTTDAIVYMRDPNVPGHLHIIFDEQGRELYRQWNDDAPKKR